MIWLMHFIEHEEGRRDHALPLLYANGEEGQHPCRGVDEGERIAGDLDDLDGPVTDGGARAGVHAVGGEHSNRREEGG